MTFYSPDFNVRRNAYVKRVIMMIGTMCDNGSILSTNGLYGRGPLYDIGYELLGIITCAHYDRLTRKVPLARPFWNVAKEEIKENAVTIFARWRGYRCEEEGDPDAERPERDIRPFLSIHLEKKRTHIKVTLTALPSGRTKSFSLPFRLKDKRTFLALRRVVDFVLSVVDEECEVNASIALRDMVHTRSQNLFIDGPCRRCGSKSHMFM